MDIKVDRFAEIKAKARAERLNENASNDQLAAEQLILARFGGQDGLQAEIKARAAEGSEHFATVEDFMSHMRALAAEKAH